MWRRVIRCVFRPWGTPAWWTPPLRRIGSGHAAERLFQRGGDLDLGTLGYNRLGLRDVEFGDQILAVPGLGLHLRFDGLFRLGFFRDGFFRLGVDHFGFGIVPWTYFVDDNGAAHIQAGIVGPSEMVPVREGELALSRWQNLFLCDFDGPRRARQILVTIMGAS